MILISDFHSHFAEKTRFQEQEQHETTDFLCKNSCLLRSSGKSRISIHSLCRAAQTTFDRHEKPPARVEKKIKYLYLTFLNLIFVSLPHVNNALEKA